MDGAEIVSDNKRISTPAGTFDKCVHVLETSALEKSMRDHRWYAEGVGPVKDRSMVLIKYGSR